jgi:hypothetical protein
VTPGTRVVALIINALISQQPLYHIKKLFPKYELDLLFEEKVDIESLHDSCFGRVLDKLAALESLPQLVQTVALSAINHGKIVSRSVHADTTSISVYGNYELTQSDLDFQKDTGKKLIDIQRGYNKQHRGDLKLYTCGLVVSKDGIPLTGNVSDGKLNDQIWNREILKQIKTSFLDPRQIIYVADSSLVNKKTWKYCMKKRSGLSPVYHLDTKWYQRLRLKHLRKASGDIHTVLFCRLIPYQVPDMVSVPQARVFSSHLLQIQPRDGHPSALYNDWRLQAPKADFHSQVMHNVWYTKKGPRLWEPDCITVFIHYFQVMSTNSTGLE